jgi:hypothetical protein
MAAVNGVIPVGGCSLLWAVILASFLPYVNPLHRADHADFHLEFSPALQYPFKDSTASADRAISGAFRVVYAFRNIQIRVFAGSATSRLHAIRSMLRFEPRGKTVQGLTSASFTREARRPVQA